MIKLIINYTQHFGGEIIKDSYTRYFSEDVNIEKEKFEIEERLYSDPCVVRVFIEEVEE